MKTTDALLVAGSLLVTTVFAELVVRQLDGLPLFELPLPAGSIDSASAAQRDRVARTEGVSAEWFFSDPPPLPNRARPPDGWTRLFRQVKDNRADYLPFFEGDIFRVWNAAFVADPCSNAILRKAPGGQLEVYDSAGGNKPNYRFPANVTTPLGLTTNQIGWRGRPILDPRPDRTVRIVFVGASAVVGGHSLPFSFPEYLDHWLNLWAAERKLDVRFEVLNAGRESIGSIDIAAIVAQEVLPLRPDLVIYYEGGNEFDLASVVPDAPAGRPQPAKSTAETGPGWLVALARHSALARRIQAALGYAASDIDGREWPKPDYTLVWPPGLDEKDPDLAHPRLPVSLGTIQRHLDRIRTQTAAAGTEFVLSSFIMRVKDGMVLNPMRQRHFIEQLNVFNYPYRYRDLERLASFQNRFLAKYARVHGLPFIDVAATMPDDPDLFSDHVHPTAAGLRVEAWVFLQQLVPLIRQRLASGVWPKPLPPTSPPLAAFQSRRLDFVCKP